MTNCGRIATRLPSSASCSRARAASYCFACRPVRYDTKTLASTTTRCKSDAPSALARFGDCLHRVVGSTLHRARQRPQGGTFSADRDLAAAHFPPQFRAGGEVERFAHFLRDGRLSLAGHRRDWHGVGVSLRIVLDVRIREHCLPPVAMSRVSRASTSSRRSCSSEAGKATSTRKCSNSPECALEMAEPFLA